MKTNKEQRAFLDAAMQEISLASGISPETLRALPVKSQADILFLHAALPDDAVMLHRRMREHLAVAALPDIAALLKTPLPALKALPAEQQKAICGAFDMLYGTLSDEETFYFDKKRRADMRTASVRAGQTADKAEPQRAKDVRNVG